MWPSFIGVQVSHRHTAVIAVPSAFGPTGNGDRLDDAEQNSQVAFDRAFRVASMVMSNVRVIGV